jgi:hypothetical protein
VISLNKPELFYPTTFFYDYFNHQSDLQFSSMKLLAKRVKNREDYEFFAKFLWSYFININYFVANGFNIVNAFKSRYEAFDSANNFFAVDSNGFCIALNNTLSNYNECNNGDQTEYGAPDKVDYKEYGISIHHDNASYNTTLVAIMNTMLDEISAAGIQPIIMFIPEFRHHSFEDEALIAKTLHAHIIDLSNLKVPRDSWHDEEHMNFKGREVYTQNVAREIKPLLDV